MGEKLDPDCVTAATGLTACQTRWAGAPRGSRSTFTQGMWAFDGQGGARSKDWESLEEGLAFVLDRLQGTEGIFATLKDEFEVQWWCGHFQSVFDGGPQLSSSVLERLARFGAGLFIDNYFSDESGRVGALKGVEQIDRTPSG